MTGSFAVGCPTAHRAWILEHWFDHVEAACLHADVEPTYVFVVDTTDVDTMEIIERRAARRVIADVPNTKGADTRDWHRPGRFEHMVVLRNELLGLVRTLSPDHFLSLDSDILLHPVALQHLLDDVIFDGWDAVGGKCFMTETSDRFPSWGQLGREGQILRTNSDGYFEVEVIMAIKLMSQKAYGIDYRHDLQGEDVGWSRACREAGLRLAWDGRAPSKHVLGPHLLHRRDPRVGY